MSRVMTSLVVSAWYQRQKQGVEQKIFENFSIFLSLIANLRFDSPVTKGEVGNLFLLALGGKPFFYGVEPLLSAQTT